MTFLHRTGPDQDQVVVSFRRPEVDPEELREAFDNYRAVTGCAARTAVTPAVAAVRARLTRLLLNDGWEPPESVLDQLRRDDELLSELVASAS